MLHQNHAMPAPKNRPLSLTPNPTKSEGVKSNLMNIGGKTINIDHFKQLLLNKKQGVSAGATKTTGTGA
jgi:hypothetical protein